jgi:hypothetical protein
MGTAPPPAEPHLDTWEHELGKYSIYRKGNSRTMTIPADVGLISGDQVVFVQGDISGRPMYVRAIEHDGTAPNITVGKPHAAAREGVVNETWCDILDVRQAGTLTIPSDIDKQTFALETELMFISGEEDDTRYLTAIPEHIWRDHRYRSLILGGTDAALDE